MINEITLRRPVSEDGMAVFRLVEQSPPLDPNSSYCNLLQCSHFASTCVVAEMDGLMVGFVSAYVKPDDPDTLFVWQVVVSEAARGKRLASAMLKHLLDREACRAVRWLETTITEANQASWALFQGLARDLGAGLTRSVLFDRQRHFDAQHDSELLARIGPLHPGA